MKYCLVGAGVTSKDYKRDSLHRRHRHISSEDREVLLRRGLVECLEWLDDPYKPDEPRRVLRFVKQFWMLRLPLRGATSRYGDYLANAIRRGEGWALIVQGEMQRRCSKGRKGKR